MPESEDAVLLQRRARRRLVGAIALVVFVVIVLPIVFDREPRPITQDLTIEIPSQDSGKFNPRLAPPAAPVTQPSKVPAAPEPKEASPEATKPAAQTGSPTGSPTPPAPVPQTAKASAADAPKAAPEAPTTGNSTHDQSAHAPRPKETFIVPLGAYSNPVNARHIQSRVAAAGYRAYLQSVKASSGTQLRVRAGPFPTREAAERARQKLKALGLKPVGAVAVREQS